MHNFLRLCAFFILIFCAACGKPVYQGLPNLPMKNWLADSKEKQPELEKVKIYSPDKKMTMDDLVWMAIQQSPAISKGNINLEIREISKSDARWEYLPEMHLIYHITNNLTKYNESSPYKRSNYGETTYEVTFSGRYANPVTTFLNVNAQNELLKTAIATQRTLITSQIFKIAQALLNLYSLEEMEKIIKEQIKDQEKRLEAANIRASHSNSAYTPQSQARTSLNSLDLRLRENKMEQTVERSNLKELVGLDLNQALLVDSSSVLKLLSSFRPERISWQECWRLSAERYMSAQQEKLEAANVYLAWASYLPSISLGVNESPGKGQSQPYQGEADQFFHLTFAFPLLDWGHRKRSADMAGLRKKQRAIETIENERAYAKNWEISAQKLALAKIRVERSEDDLKITEQTSSITQTQYENAQTSLENLSQNLQAVLSAQTSLVETKNEEQSTLLEWMSFSGELARHYLGQSGLER